MTPPARLSQRSQERPPKARADTMAPKRRRSKKKEPEEEEETEYVEGASQEEQPTKKSRRDERSQRRSQEDEAPPSQEEEEEKPPVEPPKEALGHDANERRKFKLYVDQMTKSYRTDPHPEKRIKSHKDDDEAPAGAKKEKERAEALAEAELDVLVKKMARYLLLRGTKRLPIVKSKLGEVMGDYRKNRITSYVLQRAADELRKTWGYELVQAPDKCGDYEYKGNARDSMYLVHKKKARGPDHAALTTNGLDDSSAASRGLLLTCLSIAQAQGGSVRETELYRLLNALDERIADEPPAKTSQARGSIPDLGHVAKHVESYVQQQYLVAYKDAEDENCLQLGPRALVDVGRFQIAQFTSDALGHEAVDPSIITEIQDSVRDDAAAQAAQG